MQDALGNWLTATEVDQVVPWMTNVPWPAFVGVMSRRLRSCGDVAPPPPSPIEPWTAGVYAQVELSWVRESNWAGERRSLSGSCEKFPSQALPGGEGLSRSGEDTTQL